MATQHQRASRHLVRLPFTFLAIALAACGTGDAVQNGASSGSSSTTNRNGDASASSGASGSGASSGSVPTIHWGGGDSAESGPNGQAEAGDRVNDAGYAATIDGGGGDAAASSDAGAVLAEGGSAVTPFPPGVTSPKITIVGDSIAAGPGCYKKYLLQDLTTNGFSKFQFVGLYADSCGTVRHSAVSCSTTSQWIQPTFTMPNCSHGITFAGMSTVVQSLQPDLVMLQLGVNDVWGGTPTATILANYATLINQARSHNKNVVVVVAQIQKIMPSCSNMAAYNGAQALVSAVPAWAQSVSTKESPVFTADLWTNSDWHQTLDCVHPNDVGAQRMAGNWFDALKTILPR